MLILNDSSIHSLLLSLSRPALLHIQHALANSLLAFSTTAEHTHQPAPGITTRPTGQKTLFRPFTSPTAVGCKIIVDPAPDPATRAKDVLHGVLVICDARGVPRGVINAEEVTGFRTAMCALIPWMWRAWTREVVVFGAGKVALWTVRLVLRLRGREVERIVVVNRSRARAEALVERVRGEGIVGEGTEVRWVESGEREEVRGCLKRADAVFCTVPSEEVLFAEKDVRREEKGERKPYVSAIGAWRPNMIELDPELLKRVVGKEGVYHPVTKGNDGFILVDDLKSVSEHTGEILQSRIAKEAMIELGTMLEIRENGKDGSDSAKLNTFLREGFLIYKSVGVSVTDLASGEAILDLASKQEGLGTLITDF